MMRRCVARVLWWGVLGRETGSNRGETARSGDRHERKGARGGQWPPLRDGCWKKMMRRCVARVLWWGVLGQGTGTNRREAGTNGRYDTVSLVTRGDERNDTVSLVTRGDERNDTEVVPYGWGWFLHSMWGKSSEFDGIGGIGGGLGTIID